MTSNAAIKLKSNTLLMTCQVIASSPDGQPTQARALLDTGSTTSFISEHLTNSLNLRRSSQSIRISGIAGSSPESTSHAVVNFSLSAKFSSKKFDLSAIVLPMVTHDLPVFPVPFSDSWNHLNGIQLADSQFGRPGRVDLILGIDMHTAIECQGRRQGPEGSPTAFETKFGWVLAGVTSNHSMTESTSSFVTSFHSVSETENCLQRFWEIEEPPNKAPKLTSQELAVIQHFKDQHSRNTDGRFVVPLPKKENFQPIGESRNQAVHRFLALERSLKRKGKFEAVNSIMQEYINMDHAELVKPIDLKKEHSKIFYFPIYVVWKETSSSTKVRPVFDASAKSTSGVSLNDLLLVGPTIHPPLMDVLLRFRMHKVALTADITKMYRAIELSANDRDLHRFVWRKSEYEPLQDFRMKRVTFGVSASSFAANMAVKQNAEELSGQFPLAAQAVQSSFYVDDGLTGANDIPTAIQLRQQLQEMFSQAKFELKKWNSIEPEVMDTIPEGLKENNKLVNISGLDHQLAKTLGIEWDITSDRFRVLVSSFLSSEKLTKRTLLSNIARVFDVLGFVAPAIVTVKLLLQQTWEAGISWEDEVPNDMHADWCKWASELPCLLEHSIPRCYIPNECDSLLVELHGFCDASEKAYGGVVYMRVLGHNNRIHVSLVMSKSKVAPLKRLTIPRLELCGAVILAKLLDHVSDVLQIPAHNVFAWTDSSIALHWISGNPRKYKTFIGNRISEIVQNVPPKSWRHVRMEHNPADCLSRGVMPSELINHPLWWKGPPWLELESSQWPSTFMSLSYESSDLEMCLAASSVEVTQPIVTPEQHSHYTRLTRVMAWMLRFINSCRKKVASHTFKLSVRELHEAEVHQVRVHQAHEFRDEIAHLNSQVPLPRRSCLASLTPFLDQENVLRVGGRKANSDLTQDQKHPMIILGRSHLAHLIIRKEHQNLFHAGPTLTFASVSQKYHLVGGMRCVKSVTRACVICRRYMGRSEQQQMGQLPKERLTPAPVFSNVGVDYAGPLLLKTGHTRKPVLKKAYVCVFVCLAVKAIHLELVTELTTEAFITTFRRFIARRGCPTDVFSDHGTNFVGADRQLTELQEFLEQSKMQDAIATSGAVQGIQWHFIPE